MIQSRRTPYLFRSPTPKTKNKQAGKIFMLKDDVELFSRLCTLSCSTERATWILSSSMKITHTLLLYLIWGNYDRERSLICWVFLSRKHKRKFLFQLMSKYLMVPLWCISCQQLASPHSMIMQVVSSSLISWATWNPLSKLMWYGDTYITNSIKESVRERRSKRWLVKTKYQATGLTSCVILQISRNSLTSSLTRLH